MTSFFADSRPGKGRPVSVLRAWPLALAMLLGLSACHYVKFENHPLSPIDSARQFSRRSLNDGGLRIFLRQNLGLQFEPEKTGWSFDSLAWVAFYYNPRLDHVRATWRSAQAAAEGAHMRPNPTINVAPGFSANPPTGVPPWIPIISVDWPIETAGKRRHREEAAELEAESAHQSVFTAAWQLRGELRQALFDLALAQIHLANLRLQESASSKILTSLEARQRAGTVSAVEVAPAKLAVIRSRNVLASAQLQPGLARIKIAALLGVPASALEKLEINPLAPPTDLSETQLKRLRDQALTHRPDVLSALARYDAARAALALEVSKQYPDVHLGPAYQYDQGQSKWTLGLTAELPIFNRNQAGIAAAASRSDEMAAQFLETQAQASSDIDAAAAQWTATKNQLLSMQKLFSELSEERSVLQRRNQAGVIDSLEQENSELDLVVASASRSEAELQSILAGGNLEDALQIPLQNFDAITLAPRKDLHEP